MPALLGLLLLTAMADARPAFVKPLPSDTSVLEMRLDGFEDWCRKNASGGFSEDDLDWCSDYYLVRRQRSNKLLMRTYGAEDPMFPAAAGWLDQWLQRRLSVLAALEPTVEAHRHAKPRERAAVAEVVFSCMVFWNTPGDPSDVKLMEEVKSLRDLIAAGPTVTGPPAADPMVHGPPSADPTVPDPPAADATVPGPSLTPRLQAALAEESRFLLATRQAILSMRSNRRGNALLATYVWSAGTRLLPTWSPQPRTP